MAEEDLKFKVGAEVDGTAQTKALADAVSVLGESLQTMAKNAATAVRQAEKIERVIAQSGRSAKDATKSIKELAEAQKGLRTDLGVNTFKKGESFSPVALQNERIENKLTQEAIEATNAARIKAEKIASRYGSPKSNLNSASRNEGQNPNPGALNYDNVVTQNMLDEEKYLKRRKEISKEIRRSMQAQADAEIAYTKVVIAENAKRNAAVKAAYDAGMKTDAKLASDRDARRYATPTPASRNTANPIAKAEAQNLYSGDQLTSMGQFYKNLEKNRGGLKDHTEATFAARFALRDLSQGFLLAGTGILAFNGLILKAAIDYEVAFASIERTSGLSGQALDNLKGQFVDLAQTIPTSFAELGKIGTLAGQLNVPAARIASFTKTVAQFSSSTDVSVDASATAFGRLDALLPDVQGNYEALGSSILKVGVNSVATESQIINTASQIAAVGKSAGFSADQVIGLSASFASLGIAPEATRGTVVRVFGIINKAVAEGGGKLDQFAALSGRTSEQFAAEWGTDAAAGNLIKFMENVGSQGTKASLTLADLGITAARDVKAIQTLGQSTDIVTANMAYAATGFSDATALGDAFAITSETLGAKLQILGQSFQALAATVGGSGTGPLKVFVDILQGAVEALTELASNPIAQWGFAAIGALTAVSGAIFLIAAAIARAGAAGIALQVVRHEMLGIQTAALAASGGVRTLQSSLAGATLAATSMRTVLISTGIGAALVVGFTAIAAAVDLFSNSMKSNGDIARERFGDLSALGAALAEDTTALKGNSDGHIAVAGSIETTNAAQKGWVTSLETSTGAQVDLDEGMIGTNSRIREQTYFIGENSEAWLANKIANDEAIQALFANRNKLETSGLNVEGFATALAKGDTAAATKIYDDFRTLTSERSAADSVLFAKSDVEAVDNMKLVLDSTVGALDAAAVRTEVLNSVSETLGGTINAVTGEIEFMGDTMDAGGESAEAFSDRLTAAFAGLNVASQLGASFTDLAVGLIDAGVGLDVFSAAGADNVANLQGAIAASVAAGEAMGMSATESVSALFSALQQKGVDTAALLIQVANIGLSIPGVDFGAVAAAVSNQASMGSAAQSLTKNLSGIVLPARKAASSLGGGRGGGGGGSVGGAAKAAAKEIRTLLDYAGDLGKVFSRSFDLRFGNQKALDTVTEGWRSIAEASADAAESMAQSKAELDGLSAEKDILTFFLGVAIDYGDTLRANEIQAEIAKNAAATAEEQKNLTDAQSDGSKELEGNSAAAVANRATILGLVDSYQTQIETMAANGASQAELEAASVRLKGEFINQALAAGYSSAQIGLYASSFDDMTTAIQKVPRKVTVEASANTSPVLLALKEMEAAASRAGAAAGNNIRNGITGGIGGAGIALPPIALPAFPNFDPSGYNSGLQFKQGFRRGANGAFLYGDGTGSFTKAGEMKFLSSGGYVGDGGKEEPKGIVHGGEFVFTKEATSHYGVSNLMAMMNSREGYQTAATAMATGAVKNSSAMNVVALDAAAMQILTIIAQRTGTTIKAEAIGRATSSAYIDMNNRGSN